LAKSVNIYQIYYDEASYKNCLDGFIPFYNDRCSPFFENEVIERLIDYGKHKESDYFGVFSHSFQHKIHIWPKNIFEAINQSEYDVYSFFAGMKTNNIFLKGDAWHENFSLVCKKILEKMGYRQDIADHEYKTRCIVYQNHFVAKAKVYEDYVNKVLRPALHIMSTDEEIKEIIWKDAKYHKSKKSEVRERLMEQIGVDYYPYHPFVCERLFSFYMDLNPQLTFKQII
jgi:hypothetical protein